MQGAAHWPSHRAHKLFPFFICRCRVASWDVLDVHCRACRIRKILGDVNEAVDSLSWMAGVGGSTCSLPASAMQTEVLARLEGLAFDQQPKGAFSTPEEALRTLLRGGAPYDSRPSNEILASHQAELVSLPEDIHGRPPLEEVLPPDDLWYAEGASELMIRTVRSPEQEIPIKPYWDPKLWYNRKAYNQLVRRLHSRHLVLQ